MSIVLRPMADHDQKTIAEWRQKWNSTSRQPNLGNDAFDWIEHQKKWFDSYDRERNHFFVLAQNDTSHIYGVAGLTDIDFENRSAEIHHYTGDMYIDGHSIIAMDHLEYYAFNVLGLHSVYVETFETDSLKFKFFQKRGYKHIGTWPDKMRKVMKPGYSEFLDVNIQVLVNK